jgi:hypothetical protein
MLQRGGFKKPNIIKQWIFNKYMKFGEVTGLLKKDRRFYTGND